MIERNVLCKEQFPFESCNNDIETNTLTCGDHTFQAVAGNWPDEHCIITESALAVYMLDNNVLPTDNGSTVLVLGCPSFGLPGVAALQLGYKNTTFVAQDAQKVQDVIWPSVFLNCIEQMSLTRCFSAAVEGWKAKLDICATEHRLERFDVILLAVGEVLTESVWSEIEQVLNGYLNLNGMCLLCASAEVAETALHPEQQVPTMLQGYKCSLLQHSPVSVRAEDHLWSAPAVSVFQITYREDVSE